MTNLPISASIAPVNTAKQQFSSEDISQLSLQDFGNLLASQVAGSASASDAPVLLSADVLLPASAKDKTEADIPAGSVNTLPADILATLLGQQNPAAIAQPDAKVQTALEPETAEHQSLPTAQKTKSPIGVTTNSVSGKEPLAAESDTAIPKASNVTSGNNNFNEALKSLNAADLNKTSSNLSQKISLAAIGASTVNTTAVSPHQPAVTTPAPLLSISTPVSQAAWGDDFSQKITWIVTQRNQSAELHLNPPQLGPLDVVLKINGDQATAMFTSPHAAVRDAIEQAIPKLRDMLADNGIMLGNAMVNDQAARNPQDKTQDQAHRTLSGAPTTAIGESGNIQETRVTAIKQHKGMVDTFA